jgi:hypothetical protein
MKPIGAKQRFHNLKLKMCVTYLINIATYVDVHSFGEKILYSWDDDDNQSQDLAQNFRNPEYDGKRGFVLQKKKIQLKTKL